ncbi:MAG: amidase [Alkalispirochaeta sp.]
MPRKSPTVPLIPRVYTGVPTPEELNEILDSVETGEPRIHALLPDETDRDRRHRIESAMEEVRGNQGTLKGSRLPEETPPRSLSGMIVGVKDLFHTSDFPTRAGSSLPAEAFLEPGAPGECGGGSEGSDATAVARLRSAGAIVLAKTVSTEFAYFAPGPTVNPRNTDHTPGGSSSGSAAAVAAGFCHAALGTQTIGSISRPASFCGVVGYKPSYGRVPVGGVVPFSPSADHVGVIAADVATAGQVAAVLVDNWDTTSADTTHAKEEITAARRAKSAAEGISAVSPGLREILHESVRTVLVPDDAYLSQATESARRALEAAVERLTGLGIAVQRVSIMDDIATINEAHRAMIAREFAEVHRFWLDRYGERYHPRSLELIETGCGVSDETYESARRGQEELRKRLGAAIERHGATVWISPATPGEAPKGIDSTGDPVMNLPWTYAGVPTVSIPVDRLPHGMGPHGLPLGVQLAAPFENDETLIYHATLIEAVFT